MSKFFVIYKNKCSKCGGDGWIYVKFETGPTGMTSFCDLCKGTGVERTEVDLEYALAALSGTNIAGV